MSEYKGYTEAGKIATAKYKKKVGIQRLSLDLPNGKRDIYKAHAESKGMSLTGLIVQLLEQDMESSKGE